MKKNGITLLTIQFMLVFVLHVQAGAPVRQWTHFRGPALNGIAAGGGYPVDWDNEGGIAWKTEIHGRGWCDPDANKQVSL